MVTKSSRFGSFHGITLLYLGGILLIIAQFTHWTGFQTLFQLFLDNTFIRVFHYCIPFGCGLIILAITTGLLIFKMQNRKGKVWYSIAYIGLIGILNILIFFFSDILTQYSFSLWQNPGIYLFILGLGSFFLGFLLQLLSPIRDSQV